MLSEVRKLTIEAALMSAIYRRAFSCFVFLESFGVLPSFIFSAFPSSLVLQKTAQRTIMVYRSFFGRFEMPSLNPFFNTVC